MTGMPFWENQENNIKQPFRKHLDEQQGMR